MARSQSNRTVAVPRGLTFFAAVFVSQILACTVAFRNIPTWYALLKKPEIYPPQVFFGPIWSLVFGVMAATGARLLRTMPPGPARTLMIVCIGGQAVLSACWSEVFFGLHSLELGLYVSPMLFASAIVSALVVNRVRPATGLLLSPALVWAGLAMIANVELYLANAR